MFVPVRAPYSPSCPVGCLVDFGWLMSVGCVLLVVMVVLVLVFFLVPAVAPVVDLVFLCFLCLCLLLVLLLLPAFFSEMCSGFVLPFVLALAMSCSCHLWYLLEILGHLLWSVMDCCGRMYREVGNVANAS